MTLIVFRQPYLSNTPVIKIPLGSKRKFWSKFSPKINAEDRFSSKYFDVSKIQIVALDRKISSVHYPPGFFPIPFYIDPSTGNYFQNENVKLFIYANLYAVKCSIKIIFYHGSEFFSFKMLESNIL